MNIICLKWGDKFSHEHVNRLYRMVCKNFHSEFNFICVTENPTDIHSDIKIEPLPNYDLENWWWKLTLFENINDDVNLFFDLDVVIQNDITHFKDYAEDGKIRVIRAYWKDFLYKDSNLTLDQKLNEGSKFGIDRGYDMDMNSSIMIWQGDCTWSWKEFNKDPDMYMVKYNGIDSFLYYHFWEKLNWIPEGQVYSRAYGIDSKQNHFVYKQNHRKKDDIELGSRYFYDSSLNVCIVNGWKRKKYFNVGRYLIGDDAYHGLEHYWD